MYKLALSLVSRSVGKIGLPSLVGLALGCVLPLLLLQCSRVSLADLREEHNSLQGECAALRDNLARCREAASLHDRLLVEREREMQEINNKYVALREDFLRKLASAENDDDSPKLTQNEAASADSFQAWCYRPVPLPVRELLAAATAPASANMSPGPGPAPYGDKPAKSPRP